MEIPYNKSMLLLLIEILVLIASMTLFILGYLPIPILPLILVAWLSLHLRHLRWRDVGLRRPERLLATFGLALLVGVSYQALDILLIAPLLQKLTGETPNLSQFNVIKGNLPALIISLVISWTLAGFLEELYFRGYLLNRIQGVAGGGRTGLILALVGNALVFGIAHGYQNISGVIDTFLAGLVLGGLYLLAKRNLWLPIFTHAIVDTIGFLLIYLGMSA